MNAGVRVRLCASHLDRLSAAYLVGLCRLTL